MVNQTIQAITIAGSDSGGCAGLQADLKTFQARDVFGMNIIVALTAQNTYGVQASMPVPTGFIEAQFDSIQADYHIRACKTGMLADIDQVKAVAKKLREVDFGPYVLDPVMIAKGGHALLTNRAVDTIKEELIPLADVITPNIPEAETILNIKIRSTKDIMAAAVELQTLGSKNVIIKGGHADTKLSSDYVLLENGDAFWLSGPRIDTKNTHGTGDTFAACITAELAKGEPMKEAIQTARAYLQGALEDGIDVGHGHGPTNHWAKPSQTITITAEAMEEI